MIIIHTYIKVLIDSDKDLCDIQASKSNTYYDRSSETKQKHSISGAVQTTAHRTAPDDVPNTATMTITSQQYCQSQLSVLINKLYVL